MPDFSLFDARERQWLRAPHVDARTLLSLRDWFPVALGHDGIGWRHVPERFTAPFFSDTLARQQPHRRLACRTPLDCLDRIEAGLAPTGFIFHASRCGSTLLMQLLATLPSSIALSEPPAIDAFLRWHDAAPGDSGSVARLRQLVFALGQRRSEQERHFFIKLDSWHLPWIGLLRAAFPQTPCWFLYREPEAILASHQRQRGPQMVPGMTGPAAPGAQALAPGDLDGYCALVLADFFERALRHANGLHLLHYRQLTGGRWEQVLARMGVRCSAPELHAMRERAGRHAKTAGAAFQGDPPAALAAPPSIRQALAPLYAQLERCRDRQNGNHVTN